MTADRRTAMALYAPPFKHHRGYIWDSKNEMVADDDAVDVMARIRGWGRIQQLPDAAALQDEVGQMIADALNAYYELQDRGVYMHKDGRIGVLIGSHPDDGACLVFNEVDRADGEIGHYFDAERSEVAPIVG